ncbi:MAG: hypothetical protein LR015_11850 [Verrucomicrobia bacterium]|nr:hypothetical protein [Verrucomicrobiota bacterium]
MILDAEQIGFQAAALLKRLMEGEVIAKDTVIRVPPLRIDVAPPLRSCSAVILLLAGR